RLALLPAGPEHATPGTGEDSNRVGILAASVARLLVDRAGPQVGVARGVSECDERLAQVHVAGPAKRDRALLPGLAGHRRGAAPGIEVITRHEPRTVVADLREQGRGTDAFLAERRRDVLPSGGRRRRARRQR